MLKISNILRRMEKWKSRDAEMTNMKSKKIVVKIQLISSGAVFCGMLSLLYGRKMNVFDTDFYFMDLLDSTYYALITSGSFLWFIYLYSKENNKKIGLTAHLLIAISMGVRFAFLIDSCLFSEEVPAYTLLLFGAPSAIALLTETVLIISRYHRSIKIKYKNPLLIMNCIISGVIGIGCSVFALTPIRKGCLEDIIGALFYVGMAGTFGTIAWKERE